MTLTQGTHHIAFTAVGVPSGTTTQLLRNTSFAPQEVSDAAHHAAMLADDTIEVGQSRLTLR